VLAALGPKMLALAAEHADGAHPYNVPPEHTARAREILGSDKLLAPEQAVLLETDPTEARRIGREHVAIYRDLPNYMNNLRRFGINDDDLLDGGSDRLVDMLVACRRITTPAPITSRCRSSSRVAPRSHWMTGASSRLRCSRVRRHGGEDTDVRNL
jgi:probable F420-dependent oxidoreductase